MGNRYNLNLWWYRSTHNVIVRLIWKWKKILDVWCSRWYLGSSSDSSNQFWWLDYSQNDIIDAKRYYIDAIQYDLNFMSDLPWNQKFDMIVYADVLEHVLYPKLVLNKFDQYLNKGWEIILSVPNVANWQVRFNLLFGNFNYVDGAGIMDDTHLKIYTYHTAHKLLEESGYKITKTSWWASFFGWIINILPFLRWLLATCIILKAKKI